MKTQRVCVCVCALHVRKMCYSPTEHWRSAN